MSTLRLRQHKPRIHLWNAPSNRIGRRSFSLTCRWIARFPTWPGGPFSLFRIGPARAPSRASCHLKMCWAVTSSHKWAGEKLQIPRLRYALCRKSVPGGGRGWGKRTADPSASLGMTNGRAVTLILGREIGGTGIETAGPSTALRSGRDDKFIAQDELSSRPERSVVERPAVSLLAQKAAAITLLTPAVLLVHGYHPLADDGAVYVTGIKKLADPGLYQTDAVFALSPTHLSIFAHVLATLLRWGHLPLPALMLICHGASIFLFLLGS